MTTCAEDVVCVGPFVVGERPAPLVYQFLDAAGAPLVVTGYGTPQFVYRERDGVATQRAGAWENQALAKVRYTWQGDEFQTPGHYLAEFWIGNAGTNRFASVLITWNVRSPVGPVPNV